MADTLLEVAQILTSSLVADLAGRPLYLIEPQPGTALESLGIAQGAYFSKVRLDLAMQPHLEAAGRWRGPGVAIAMIPHNDLVADVGLAAHELSHWLDAPEVRIAPEVVATIEPPPQTAAYLTPEPTDIPAAFWSHGPEFIRACCHLWHRCNRHVPELQPLHLSFGSAYRTLEGMHLPHRYCMALEGELHAAEHLSIRHVLTTDPPAEFAELCRLDTARMFGSAHAAREAAA